MAIITRYGREFDSYSEACRVYCEANYLLAMPLEQRRSELAKRDKLRGVEQTNLVRDEMKRIFESRGAKHAVPKR